MLGIIPISGFTERNSDQTGTRDLWREVLRPFSGPDCFVHPPIRWKASPKDVVATCIEAGCGEVIVIGYSWGVGYGARRVVKEAIRRGVNVRVVLSCDGVYRPLWVPSWATPLAARAMTRWASITFPPQVREVDGVRQSLTLPSGHDVRHWGSVVPMQLLNYSHTSIDSSPEWWDLVEDTVRREVERESPAII